MILDRKTGLYSLNLFLQVWAITVCEACMYLVSQSILGLTCGRHTQRKIGFIKAWKNSWIRSSTQQKNEWVPKGISICSAIPSMPMNVNETIVTMGIVAQPNSFTRTKGREKRYSVTHCLRWIPSENPRSMGQHQIGTGKERRTWLGNRRVGDPFYTRQLIN